MNTKLFKKLKSIAIAIIAFLPVWILLFSLFRGGADSISLINSFVGGGYTDFSLSVPQFINENFVSFFDILGISGQYAEFIAAIIWTYIIVFIIDIMVDLLLLIPSLCKNAFSKGV